MMYWVCPYCKAHLDFGEKCDCNRGAQHENNINSNIEKGDNKDGWFDESCRYEGNRRNG